MSENRFIGSCFQADHNTNTIFGFKKLKKSEFMLYINKITVFLIISNHSYMPALCPSCLHIRPDLTGTVLDHETGLSLVSLPRPEDILDQTQASLTQRILDNLGNGLDVGISENVIYGQRRGEVRAYWSSSKFDSSRQPREISKLNPEPLFRFKDFVAGA